MKHEDNLMLLESMLESFLERAVAAKEKRLRVVSGINRLDDISLDSKRGADVTDRMGNWFAEHNAWLTEEALKPGDVDRIGRILGDIRNEIEPTQDASPATRKIGSVMDIWRDRQPSGSARLTLKKGPEQAESDIAADDTVAAFGSQFDKLGAILKDASSGKLHILSVLDDTLKSAEIKPNKEALLLSAFIIYYLKLGGYMVDPYVKRLKKAERLQTKQKEAGHA